MERLYRATLLTLYQISLLIGIVMMPVALITRKFGVRLPIHRLILSLKGAYENV